MKRDELIEYKADENFGNGLVYSILEVNKVLDENDAEIASLKAENESLKAKLETVNELVKTSKDLYDRTIESLKASHYADSVDAGMRERRLKRTLWLARALRARDIQRWWIAVTCAPTTERACSVWNNVERKCRAKAELYK